MISALRTTLDDSLSVSKGEHNMGIYGCEGSCYAPFTDKLENNYISFQLAPPRSYPVGFAYGNDFVVIHKDVFAIIEDHLAQSIKVLPARFEESDSQDWIALQETDRVVTRGHKNANVRKCSECGALLYFAVGKPYFCLSAEVTKVRISDLCHVLLPEELVPAVSKLKLSGVELQKIPNLQEPKDGLPYDLNEHFPQTP